MEKKNVTLLTENCDGLLKISCNDSSLVGKLNVLKSEDGHEMYFEVPMEGFQVPSRVSFNGHMDKVEEIEWFIPRLKAYLLATQYEKLLYWASRKNLVVMDFLAEGYDRLPYTDNSKTGYDEYCEELAALLAKVEKHLEEGKKRGLSDDSLFILDAMMQDMEHDFDIMCIDNAMDIEKRVNKIAVEKENDPNKYARKVIGIAKKVFDINGSYFKEKEDELYFHTYLREWAMNRIQK